MRAQTEHPVDELGEKPRAPPHVARLMALAIHLESLTNDGGSCTSAQTARKVGLSRARITQIIHLNLLAPDIQEAILQSSFRRGRESITERDLRPLVREPDWNCQRAQWKELCLRAGRNRL